MSTNQKTLQAFKDRMAAEEEVQRATLAALVDDVFDAYVGAGFAVEEYKSRQFYINLLFQAVNDTPPTSYQRQGGLLVAIRFMQRLKRMYEDTAHDPDHVRPNGK